MRYAFSLTIIAVGATYMYSGVRNISAWDLLRSVMSDSPRPVPGSPATTATVTARPSSGSW